MSRFCLPSGGNHRITSLCYSPDGLSVLVSFSSEYVYLFDVNDDSGRDPEVFSKEMPSTSSNKKKNKASLKRLRLRGDWSDTGPNSRPERERVRSPDPSDSNGSERDRPNEPEAHRPTNRSSLISGLSDLLTRFLNRSDDDDLEDSEASQSSNPSSNAPPSQPSNETQPEASLQSVEPQNSENSQFELPAAIILEARDQQSDSDMQSNAATDLPLLVKTPPSPLPSLSPDRNSPPSESNSNNPPSSISSAPASVISDEAESSPTNLVHESVKQKCKVTNDEPVTHHLDSDDESENSNHKPRRPCIKHKYTGHRNARTMVRQFKRHLFELLEAYSRYLSLDQGSLLLG